MTRARPQAPKPVTPPDPLAEFRDTETEAPPAIVVPTGTSLPDTDDGKPMEYLYAAEDLPEAIAIALALASSSEPDAKLTDALAAELLVRVGPLQPVAVALVTEDEQETVRNQMIQVWHEDTTALGFLHKGGVCGCRYIAQRVLAVVLPAEIPEELSDLRDDQPED